MKYFQFIIGCQQNYADAEKISAILDSLGYELSDEENADLILIIACSVRQKAFDRILGKIKRFKSVKKPKKYILFGCILDSDKKKLEGKIDLILDSRQINQLPKYLEQIKLPALTIKKFSRIPVSKIGYVSIGVGCNNFCSYCAVPYTRGREEYYSPQAIIIEAKDLIVKGCQEIMLLAQNVNSYQFKKEDKVYTFVDLLKLVNEIEGNFQISFLSPHPKDTKIELIKAVASLDKVKKEIHLPMQSGDDDILKKMNRHYTAKQYLDLVKKIRNYIPEIYLSTDIIVGFPTETENQFNNTVKVVQMAKFNKAFVSQYSARKGTLSAKIYADDILPDIKKRRWQALDQIINIR